MVDNFAQLKNVVRVDSIEKFCAAYLFSKLIRTRVSVFVGSVSRDLIVFLFVFFLIN